MGNFKEHPKYTSQLNLDRNWVYAPGQYFRFAWTDYNAAPGRCFLVALQESQIKFILKALTLAHIERNWGTPIRLVPDDEWNEISTFVDRTEFCLMAGCSVEDLIVTQRLLIGAITGTLVELDEPLRTTGSYDFSAIGLATKFTTTENPTRNIADVLASLETNLGELQIAIGSLSDGDLEDDLAAVWGKLSDIAKILGAAPSQPPQPL